MGNFYISSSKTRRRNNGQSAFNFMLKLSLNSLNSRSLLEFEAWEFSLVLYMKVFHYEEVIPKLFPKSSAVHQEKSNKSNGDLDCSPSAYRYIDDFVLSSIIFNSVHYDLKMLLLKYQTSSYQYESSTKSYAFLKSYCTYLELRHSDNDEEVHEKSLTEKQIRRRKSKGILKKRTMSKSKVSKKREKFEKFIFKTMLTKNCICDCTSNQCNSMQKRPDETQENYHSDMRISSENSCQKVDMKFVFQEQGEEESFFSSSSKYCESNESTSTNETSLTLLELEAEERDVWDIVDSNFSILRNTTNNEDVHTKEEHLREEHNNKHIKDSVLFLQELHALAFADSNIIGDLPPANRSQNEDVRTPITGRSFKTGEKDYIPQDHNMPKNGKSETGYHRHNKYNIWIFKYVFIVGFLTALCFHFSTA